MWHLDGSTVNVLWAVAFFVAVAAAAVELKDNGRRVNSHVLLALAWAVFFYMGWRT